MKLLAIIFCLGLVSPTVQADTYNFIFSKPKKGASEKKKAEEKGEEPAPAPPPPPTASVEPPPAPRRSWFRMGFAGILIPDRIVYDNSASYNKVGVLAAGGMVSVTFSTSTTFGFSIFLGVEKNQNRRRADGILGGEFEINPFSTDPVIYSTLEFNFLVGTNLGALESSRDDSAFLHAGGRLNYNVNQRFGFTGAVRFSTGGQMLELGLVTRL